MALTRHGVLVIGPVTTSEWECGFIVCWHRLPKKPFDWDEILEVRLKESNVK